MPDKHALLNVLKKFFKTDTRRVRFNISIVEGTTLTVELRLLERLDLADVDTLHGVDALHGLEDLSGDVLGDAATREARTTADNKKSV